MRTIVSGTVTALAALGILTGGVLADASQGPEPWTDAYDAIREQLDGFTFEHPMTVTNPRELEVVRQRIADGVEPQASAYEALIADADEVLDFEPNPPESMTIMGGYQTDSNLSEKRSWLWREGDAAYTSALAYLYSGETHYADNAVRVLNAWAEADTTFSGNDRGLQLGSWFSQMLYAADILHEYEGWEPDDRERFQDWWRERCLPHVKDVMRNRVNNWKDAGVLGVLAASVALRDKDLLEEGLIELKSYFHGRTDTQDNDGAGWKIVKDDNGVYLHHEVTRNQGRSGVTYTAYSLTTMAQALEIARHAGFDFWHSRTPQDAGVDELIKYYFRWDVLEEPFPWYDGPDRRAYRKNPYELANNHFGVMPEMTDWLEENRPVDGRQGDRYITLNKGDIEPR